MKVRCATFSIIFSMLVCYDQPAFATGEFERGCEFYKQKNYKEARINFEKASKIFPSNWAVHYYLANTHLASGQSSSAKREYELCLTCKPDAATAKNCQNVLAKLGGITQSSSAASVDGLVSAETKTEAKAPDAKPTENASPTLLHERARAAEIMKRAEAECAKIRAETKEKLDNGSTLSNARWITPEGVPYTDWTTDQRNDIEKDADERCKQIMDQAVRSTSHATK